MDFLKKNIKWIVLVIVLMIIASGVSVFATNQYLASQVTYKDGKSVADALNDLYEQQNEKILNPNYNYTVLFNKDSYGTSNSASYTTTKDYPVVIVIAYSANDSSALMATITCSNSNYKEIISNAQKNEGNAYSKTSLGILSNCPAGTEFSYSGRYDTSFKVIGLE